jgi:hypothetical protein
MQHVVRKDAEHSGRAGVLIVPTCMLPVIAVTLRLTPAYMVAQRLACGVQGLWPDKRTAAMGQQTPRCVSSHGWAHVLGFPLKDPQLRAQSAKASNPSITLLCLVQCAASVSIDQDGMRPDRTADLTYTVSEAIDHIGAAAHDDHAHSPFLATPGHPPTRPPSLLPVPDGCLHSNKAHCQAG